MKGIKKIGYFLFVLGALFTAFIPAQAQEKGQVRPEIGPYMAAYRSWDLAEVWIARVGPRADNQVLIQVLGIDHDWDKRVWKATVETVKNNEKRYTVTVDGKKYTLLTTQEGAGELFLPGETGAQKLHYDRDLSRAGDPPAFLTFYLRQEGLQP